MQRRDQYRDRGMSHGQPAPHIPAGVQPRQEAGAAGEFGRGPTAKIGGKGTCGPLICEEQTVHLIAVSRGREGGRPFTNSKQPDANTLALKKKRE